MRQKQSSALSRIKLIGEGFATVAGQEPEMNSSVPHLPLLRWPRSRFG
jgi:hypothetical protein